MFKIAVILAVVACAYGNFYNTGSCPTGRAVGDKWNPAGSCMECYCDLTGYGCSSCKTLSPVTGCYQKTVNTTLQYPECCPSLVCQTFNGLGTQGHVLMQQMTENIVAKGEVIHYEQFVLIPQCLF